MAISRTRQLATEACVIVTLSVLYFVSFRLESPVNGYSIAPETPRTHWVLEVFDQDTCLIIKALVEGTPFAWNPQHHLLYHWLTERMYFLIRPWVQHSEQTVYLFLKTFTVATGVAFLIVYTALLRAFVLAPALRLGILLLTGLSVSAWFNFSAFETHSLGMAAIAGYLLAFHLGVRRGVFSDKLLQIMFMCLVFLVLNRIDNLRFVFLTVGCFAFHGLRSHARRLLPMLAAASLTSAALYVPLAVSYFHVPISQVPSTILDRTERSGLKSHMTTFRYYTPKSIAGMAVTCGMYATIMPVGENRFRTPFRDMFKTSLGALTTCAFVLFFAVIIYHGCRRRMWKDPFVASLLFMWAGNMLFYTWLNRKEPFLWTLEFLPLTFVGAATILERIHSLKLFLAIWILCILLAVHNTLYFWLAYR